MSDCFPRTYEWNDGTVRLEPPPPGGSGIIPADGLCTPARHILTAREVVDRIPDVQFSVDRGYYIEDSRANFVTVLPITEEVPQMQTSWEYEQWRQEQLAAIAENTRLQMEYDQQQQWAEYQRQEQEAQEIAYAQAMQEYAAQQMEQELEWRLEQQRLEVERETARQQQELYRMQFEQEQEWRVQLEQMLQEQQQIQIVEEEQYVEEPVYHEEQPQYFEQPQPEYVPVLLPYVPQHDRRPRRKMKPLSRNFLPTIPVENWPNGEETNGQSDTRISTMASRSKP